MTVKYAVAELNAFTTELFERAGLSRERAAVMASVFIDADLMGFTTHGMNRVPINLEWLLSGESRISGEPHVLADRGNTFNWDAEYLPGPWVLMQAINTALARVPGRGVVAATIRRSQHIACVAVYCARIVEAGYVALITCATPSENTVCAHGGMDPVFSANPIAFGAPADGRPLLFDISMSVTAGGYVARAMREGTTLPEPCLKDNQGNISDRPEAFFSDPQGSILPIGGAIHGYKGAALCIFTEVLTMALGGYGRANQQSQNDGEANSVFLQIVDPRAFCDMDQFKQEVSTLRRLCENSRVPAGQAAVRFPGRRAWDERARQQQAGVELYPNIMADIKPWAERFGVSLPRPFS